MADVYAIVTLIRGRKYYWCKRTRLPRTPSTRPAGTWGDFHDATHFTAVQRKQYPLPANGEWISVLHGFGSTPYPADSELTAHYR